MKYTEFLGGVALAGLLLLPVATFARDKNEGDLSLSNPVQVGSTLLKPGDYKVEWHGTGPTVNVDFLRDHKTVATTSAKVVAYTSGPDAFVTEPATGKSQNAMLKEVDFAKQKEGLKLTPTS